VLGGLEVVPGFIADLGFDVTLIEKVAKGVIIHFPLSFLVQVAEKLFHFRTSEPQPQLLNSLVKLIQVQHVVLVLIKLPKGAL
jgi:hypothetical protein